jgi:hypothetical protein
VTSGIGVSFIVFIMFRSRHVPASVASRRVIVSEQQHSRRPLLVETRRSVSSLVAATTGASRITSSDLCRSASVNASMTVSRKLQLRLLQNNRLAWKAPPPPPPSRTTRRLFSDKNKPPAAATEQPVLTTEQCAADLAQLSSTTTTWSNQLAQNLSPSQRQQVNLLLETMRAESIVNPEAVLEPSVTDLRLVALTVAIPFVGFGIMDNAILIIAGDAIDTSLGVLLGISTMCAAAIGNIISDVCGILFGTVIEDWCALYLNLPQPNLSQAQRKLRSVRFAQQFGCGVGIVIGCVIGMFPLLFIDSNRIQVRKREKHLDSIFRDVVHEAKSLIGAQQTCLFLLVDAENDPKKKGSTRPVPTPDGKYLYAKYGASSDKNVDRILPLGRGIVSRAALTGQAWNIPDVRTEPDFTPEMAADIHLDNKSRVRNMVVVPVLDGQGRAIAVIRAVNKVGKGRGDPDGIVGGGVGLDMVPSFTARSFTNGDVQILKALASHISVSLQRVYEAHGEEAELRLKDTIRILKDYGLEGITEGQSTAKRRPLFPE